MLKKLKPGKISIVVFLTFLIWVWADLAQDDELPLSDVRIEVAKSSDPSLWVNFVVDQADPNLQTSVALDAVVLKGPAARIGEVRARKNRGALDLNLFLVPEQEGLTQAETHRLDVLDFLRRNDQIRKLGLTVVSCEPQKLTLQTHKLEEQFVNVECVGIDTSLRVANLDPSSVAAYVPAGETLQAKIRLTSDDQDQAKIGAIEKTPYIELIPGVPGQRRDVSTKVKVTLGPAKNVLSEWTVPATYAFVLGPNVQAKYQVVLENEPTELTGVTILATAQAREAYYNAPNQLLLYIRDQDIQTTQWPISREFVFAFPEDYVRQDQIRAKQSAPIARFTLLPVVPETSPKPELSSMP